MTPSSNTWDTLNTICSSGAVIVGCKVVLLQFTLRASVGSHASVLVVVENGGVEESTVTIRGARSAGSRGFASSSTSVITVIWCLARGNRVRGIHSGSTAPNWAILEDGLQDRVTDTTKASKAVGKRSVTGTDLCGILCRTKASGKRSAAVVARGARAQSVWSHASDCGAKHWVLSLL